jgi:hypothetical protein
MWLQPRISLEDWCDHGRHSKHPNRPREDQANVNPIADKLTPVFIRQFVLVTQCETPTIDEMSVSFTIESFGVGTEDGIVKLFEHSSAGDRVEVRRTIALKGDELDESGQFRLRGPDWHKAICIHLVAKLLSIPEDAESLVAWYTTVGLASFFLGTGRTGQEITEAVRLEKSFEITTESILGSIAEAVEIATEHRISLGLHLISYDAVPYFLLQELHNDPFEMKKTRDQIGERITSYLNELRFADKAIKLVRSEIEEVNIQLLREFEASAGGDPWHRYFRGLDDTDLSLFHPDKPFSNKKAYAAIRAWYQSHERELERLAPRKDDYAARSKRLIDALPPLNRVNDLEIRAVFNEVLMGLLEWGFHDSDGKYKMSEYAKLALRSEGLPSYLSEAESQHLVTSWIWPYIKK